MAFTDLGSIGATGSTSNNQSTLDLTTTLSIAAGNLVVVVVAADNIASGGDDGAVTGVTLGVGGQAFTKGKQIANALAAQAGASASLWYCVASSAFASGGTIRATFGSASLVDASGLTGRAFSMVSTTAVVEGTPGSLVSDAGADPGSLNVTTANIACLRIRGIASQVGNNTNLTPTSTWTAWANGNSATSGTVAEVCARAEHLISTATGAASDPTYVSAIYASVYVAFKEGPIVPTSGTLAGVSTAAATGRATAATTGTAAGTSTASATGRSIAATVGTATGAGGAAAVGDSTVPATVRVVVSFLNVELTTGITSGAAGSGAGTAAGVGGASATGRATAATSGTAAGVGTATATGRAVVGTRGTAAGIGGASATSAVIAATIGTSNGVGMATADGTTAGSVGSATGTAAGVGGASAVSIVTAATSGSASGVGTAAATGAFIAAVTGSASGVGGASATSATISGNFGTATGIGGAAGVTIVTAAAVGNAAGVGGASAVGSGGIGGIAANDDYIIRWGRRRGRR